MNSACVHLHKHKQNLNRGIPSPRLHRMSSFLRRPGCVSGSKHPHTPETMFSRWGYTFEPMPRAMMPRLDQWGLSRGSGNSPGLGRKNAKEGRGMASERYISPPTSLSFAQFQRDQKPRLIQANVQSVRNERNFGDFIYIRNTLYYSRYSHYSSLNLFV